MQNKNKQPISRAAKMCKILSNLCMAAFVAVALWGIFVFCLMIYSVLSSNLISDGVYIGLAVPFIYLLYMVNSSLIPFILWRMLGDISKARTPFTLENSKRLFRLAFILLLYTVLESLLIAVDTQFMLSVGDTSIQVGNFVYDFASHSGSTFNVFPLEMAAVFFALSYVFKYGVLLQQESDETL